MLRRAASTVGYSMLLSGILWSLFVWLAAGCSGPQNATPKIIAVPVTATSPPTAPASDELVRYENKYTGVAFQYPGDWFLFDNEFPKVSSYDQFATAHGEEPAERAQFVVVPQEANSNEKINRADVLNQFASGAASDGLTLEQTLETQLNGHDALIAIFHRMNDAGDVLLSTFAVIQVNDHRVITALSNTSSSAIAQEKYNPVLQEMLYSIEVMQPAELVLLEPVEDFVDFNDVSSGLSIQIPESWIVTATYRVGHVFDFALISNEAVLADPDNPDLFQGAYVRVEAFDVALAADRDPAIIVEQNAEFYNMPQRIDPIRRLDVNGQEGATATYSGTVSGGLMSNFIITVIVHEDRAMSIIAYVAKDNFRVFRDILNRMLDSVEIDA